MDQDFYDRMGALTAKLADKFMTDATLSSAPAAGAYDPRTGKTTQGVASHRRVQAVRGSRKTYDENGVLTRETIASMVEKPNVGDTLTIGDHAYRVTSVEDVAPVGVSYFYRAILT